MPYRSRYGTTATDSRARQSRPVTLLSNLSAAPPGKSMTWAGNPGPFGRELVSFIARTSTSHAPSGRGVEKCTASPRPTLTWAGSVPVSLTTSRSPGNSRPGRSRKAWWLTCPVARRLSSSRTPSRGRPRASGGSWASRSAGRVKSMTISSPGRWEKVRGAVPAARQPLGHQPGERGHHRVGPGPVRDVLAGEGLLVHVGTQVAWVGPPHPDGEFLGGQHVGGLLQGRLGR